MKNVWDSPAYVFKKTLFFIIYFLRQGKRGEREREKHRCVRETRIDCLSHVPLPGTGLTPGMCPDPNHTSDLSLCPMLRNQLSYTGQR